jgi:HSP20 family protein
VNRFFNDSLFEGSGTSFPAVDVKENENNYLMEVELPGLSEKDIDVKVENGTLTISSKKEEHKEERREGYLRKERRHYSFSRSFKLPENADHGKIDANLKSGLLRISIPKSAESQPRMIDVKADE